MSDKKDRDDVSVLDDEDYHKEMLDCFLSIDKVIMDKIEEYANDLDSSKES